VTVLEQPASRGDRRDGGNGETGQGKDEGNP